MRLYLHYTKKRILAGTRFFFPFLFYGFHKRAHPGNFDNVILVFMPA